MNKKLNKSNFKLFEAENTTRFKLKNVSLTQAKRLMKQIQEDYGLDIQDVEISISHGA